MRVRVHILSYAPWQGHVVVAGSWGGNGVASSSVSVTAGQSKLTVTVAAPRAGVRLWWPTGLNPRPMYNTSAQLIAAAGCTSGSATRRVGFRVLAIVTGNDTDTAWAANA